MRCEGLFLLAALWMASIAHAQPAPPPNAIETATGIRYVVLKPAAANARTVTPGFVEFRASIRTADGKPQTGGLDEGVQRMSFTRLAQALPGLARAVLSSPIGETRRWWIGAAQLRPGYAGMPEQDHVIELTVIGNYDPVKAPADVAVAPADAIRTASGLAYKVLNAGPGGAKPTLQSVIEIHYSGWTTDGTLFDSSVQRDQRAVFPLAQLIPGWQEGLQLMSPGDTVRFWIPGALAYDTMPARPGAPRGPLVFDVTLYSFQ